MLWQDNFTLRTSGRGTCEITQTIEAVVQNSGVQRGICHLFIRHTSASLMISENTDPAVHVDLETFMAKISPDGDPMFTHRAEGDDDMPAHVRSVITQTELSVPIQNGTLALGTWQGIYLWEHRKKPHRREIIITVYGE